MPRQIRQLLLLAALSIAAVAYPQAATAQATCDNGVVLYQYTNFQGRCVAITSDVAELSTYNFNDMASSIRFLGSYACGWEATLYQHTFWNGGGGANGSVSTFRGYAASLSDYPIGNNQASSIRIRQVYPCITQPAGPTPAPPTPSQQAWTVSLSADTTNPQANQTVTLTARTNQDVGPTRYSTEIYTVSPSPTIGEVEVTCTGGTICTAYRSGIGTTVTYRARVSFVDGSNVQAQSNTITITWPGAPPPPPPPASAPTRPSWRSTIEVDQSQYQAGATVVIHVTIAATSTTTSTSVRISLVTDDPAGNRQITDTFIPWSTDHVFTITAPQVLGTYTTALWVEYDDGNIQPVDHPAWVTWQVVQPWTISLSADNYTPESLQPVMLTAIANQDVGRTPYFIIIYDVKSSEILTKCSDGTQCIATVPGYLGARTFIASIARNESDDVQVESDPVSIVWTSSSPTVSSPSTPSTCPANDATWPLQQIHADDALSLFPDCTPPSIGVAVIDSGVDTVNPGLAGRISSRTDYVTDDYAADEYGHGTHVAGIIAGNGSNGMAIAGVMPTALIDVYKVTQKQSVPPSSCGADVGCLFSAIIQSDDEVVFVAEAINDATTRGDKVINISSVFRTDVLTSGVACNGRCLLGQGKLERAVRDAYSSGVVIVAAAGEDDSGCAVGGQKQDKYPAAFADTYPNVIAVVAASRRNGPALCNGREYSDFGNWATIGAPGGEPQDQILVLHSFGTLSQPVECHLGGDRNCELAVGTSFAAPHVAGVVALMFAANPNLSPEQVRAIVTSTSIPWTGNVPSTCGANGHESCFGAGVVNAAKAVEHAQSGQ